MSERPDDDVAVPEVDPGAGSPTIDDPNQASFLGGDAAAPAAAEPAAGGADYRVFARKYRPMTFDQLIGQDAMVRTLTNAFATGRVAHAFILTGVRGIGKTTTAPHHRQGSELQRARRRRRADGQPVRRLPQLRRHRP